MISWSSLISALKRPLSVSLFISPGKEGLGDRIQDGHKNSRFQGGLGMGTQEAIFCIKVTFEKVHKFRFLKCCSCSLPDSISQKLNPLVWTPLN